MDETCSRNGAEEECIQIVGGKATKRDGWVLGR
jgi:hypothetical protein